MVQNPSKHTIIEQLNIWCTKPNLNTNMYQFVKLFQFFQFHYQTLFILGVQSKHYPCFFWWFHIVKFNFLFSVNHKLWWRITKSRWTTRYWKCKIPKLFNNKCITIIRNWEQTLEDHGLHNLDLKGTRCLVLYEHPENKGRFSNT